MIIEHPQLCNSKMVVAFLLDSSGEQFSMGKHMHEIGGDGSQFSRAYLLECSEVFTEEKAIGDFQSQGMSAILMQSSKMVRERIWGS